MLKREVGVCHVQWLLPFFFKAENCFMHLFNGSGYHLETFYAFLSLSLSLSLTHFFLIIFLKILKLKFQLFN